MATTPTRRTTAIGVFRDRVQAQQALNELRRMNFREDEIGVASREDDAARTTPATADDSASKVGTGAAAGAATGAGVGALWGLGILAGVLPAIGPVIAGGTLAAIIASAATGAAAAGLAGALIGLGIPEEEATHYEKEFHEGRTVVTVNAGGRYDEVMALLKRYGGYDLSRPSTQTEGATRVH